MANVLNLEYKQVRGYVSNFKPKDAYRIINDTRKYLLGNYKFTPDEVLIDDAKIEQQTLNKFAEYHSLTKQPFKKNYSVHIPNIVQKCKYHLDETYFDDINTEEKAYWLGFLMADGYVSKDLRTIELCIKDKEHIKKFLDAINSNAAISEKKVKLNGEVYVNYRATVSSIKFVECLIKHGCVPNKSLILKFPVEIDNCLKRHFIRGYFDGDGCVHVNTENEHFRCGFVGTKDMLNEIQNILYEECMMTKVPYTTTGNAFQFMWGGINNLRTIFNFLYRESNVYLNRKYDKFLLANNYYKNKKVA